FLKAHRKVEQQEATITELSSTVAQQRKDFRAIAARQQTEIKALIAILNEQASRIQKVVYSLKRANLRRKWSTIPKAASTRTKQQHFTISRHASPRGGFLFRARHCAPFISFC